MMESILIVDDKPDMIALLRRIIRQKMDVQVLGAESGKRAIELIRGNGTDLVISDIRMPGMDGLSLMRHIKDIDPDIVVILLTAFGTIEMAVDALKVGAYDFLTKPIEKERLIHTIRKALELRRVTREKKKLEERLKHKGGGEPLIGNSEAMNRFMETVRMVARTDETVLITGETGTGKELAARVIHSLSRRAERKFVAVNCPAIPESILESELFGYKKGAFTSATADKKGLFESADGGTIFLDEIGDIPVSIQTKLLRVLQEREFKPLGDTESVKVDVRVIASTNQDLEKKISQGLFREDLYYRLNVITINMPSLRERVDDIPLLAEYFLIEYSVEFGKSIEGFSDDALSYLVSRKWKGNVRELQNVIKRAVIFEKGRIITRESLEDPVKGDYIARGMPGDVFSLDYRTARSRAIEYFTVNYIRSLLERTGGNISRAARRAGIERQSLQHLIRKYGINPLEFRKNG